MKIQLLLRRVDPLGAGSDDPAAKRAHESTAVVSGTYDTVARSAAAAAASASAAAAAAAGPVFHRSSSAAATTAAA